MQNFKKFPLAHWWPVIMAGGLTLSAWGDTNIVTTTADSGAGSFRQAILTANTNSGPNTIVFQISGTAPFTISPATALPLITAPVVLDATTQPGFAGKPVVELDGAATSSGTVGLRFSAGASTLRGLAINRFPGPALELDSPSNTIQGNFIGTDVTGAVQQDNGSYGILVKSAGNLIGGTNAGNGNLISAGLSVNSAGIYVLNVGNNTVQGNLIGLNAAGTGAFNSVNNGIILYGSGANLIGGPVAAARNVISGNGASGIYLSGGAATGNVIQNNYIGTDVSGSNAVGNASGDGITLQNAPGNVIAGNLISGNGMAGVSIQSASGNQVLGNFIGTDVNGALALTNHNSGVSVSGGGGNQIGGTNAGAGNVLSGNALDGITLTGGTAANLVQGNLIGLTAAGASALRNNQNGITISGGTANLIGGAARNVISGNANHGVDIVTVTDSGNIVRGNYIGTDVTGALPVANQQAGVYIAGCSNQVGGTSVGMGNVISGNTEQGVWIVGNAGNAAGNVIQGNLIGVTAAGTVSLGNGVSSGASTGIGISTAANNVVGGTVAGAGNVISGNNGSGIFLVGATASGNLIQGNFIGTDRTGTVGLGNVFEGIYLEQASANQIGGTASGAGNVISGNHAQGVFLADASWNVIQGNSIGTKADGTSNLGNKLHNIELQSGADNNVIGGTAAGAGNRLAYAQTVYCGVRVRTGAANNLISGNSIFSNGGLGIDLSPTAGGTAAGVNPVVACESGVAADAANAGQNFPIIADVYSGAATRVRGSLNASAGQAYTLQFFASPVGAPSGYGAGQIYLGQTNLTLAASCLSEFTIYLPGAVPSGWVVTATATDATNNTSEFSAWVPVMTIPAVQLAKSAASQLTLSWTNNGGSYTLQQTFSLAPPITWLAVTNVPLPQNNFMVASIRLTNNSAFYRLTAP
jgi:titin